MFSWSFVVDSRGSFDFKEFENFLFKVSSEKKNISVNVVSEFYLRYEIIDNLRKNYVGELGVYTKLENRIRKIDVIKLWLNSSTPKFVFDEIVNVLERVLSQGGAINWTSINLFSGEKTSFSLKDLEDGTVRNKVQISFGNFLNHLQDANKFIRLSDRKSSGFKFHNLESEAYLLSFRIVNWKDSKTLESLLDDLGRFIEILKGLKDEIWKQILLTSVLFAGIKFDLRKFFYEDYLEVKHLKEIYQFLSEDFTREIVSENGAKLHFWMNMPEVREQLFLESNDIAKKLRENWQVTPAVNYFFGLLNLYYDYDSEAFEERDAKVWSGLQLCIDNFKEFRIRSTLLVSKNYFSTLNAVEIKFIRSRLGKDKILFQNLGLIGNSKANYVSGDQRKDLFQNIQLALPPVLGLFIFSFVLDRLFNTSYLETTYTIVFGLIYLVFIVTFRRSKLLKSYGSTLFPTQKAKKIVKYLFMIIATLFFVFTTSVGSFGFSDEKFLSGSRVYKWSDYSSVTISSETDYSCNKDCDIVIKITAKGEDKEDTILENKFQNCIGFPFGSENEVKEFFSVLDENKISVKKGSSQPANILEQNEIETKVDLPTENLSIIGYSNFSRCMDEISLLTGLKFAPPSYKNPTNIDLSNFSNRLTLDDRTDVE